MTQTTDTDSNILSEAVTNSGSYDIIRKRLEEQGRTLIEQVDALNNARLDEFGSTDMSVIARLRIHTENNCIARDIVQVGNTLLFGYNVFMGLKKETHIDDVFMLCQLIRTEENEQVSYDIETIPQQDTFLNDPSFVADFNELYTYYKKAHLIKLTVKDDKLLAAFQIGDRISDTRVFRWAIDNEGKPTYIDNRGERDIALPPPYDFDWIPTTREDSVHGRHPHMNILDNVFVETVGGDLTIKIENNTETGRGIYAEPVEDVNQSLDDADIQYAEIGHLILLKITPYRENTTRYLVYNQQTKKVDRIDAIGLSCVQLPEEHGIIFPGGLYLQNGEIQYFDENMHGMRFKRSIRSPNGEDVLYLFYEAIEGKVALFAYNLIEKKLKNPLIGHGYAINADGTMVVFHSKEEEPTRIHPMQVWQTAFVSQDYASKLPTSNSFYARIGNAELVRGISDLYSVTRDIQHDAVSASHYNQLSTVYQRLTNRYYWLEEEKLEAIKTTLHTISNTSELVLDEFEKIESIRQQAKEAMQQAEAKQREIFNQLLPDSWDKVEDYIDALNRIRQQRGHLMTIKEYRYIDQSSIASMNAQLIEAQDQLGDDTLRFLSRATALQPYQAKLNQLNAEAEAASTKALLQESIDEMEKMAGDLDLLSELMATLKIDDATVRTRIIEAISEIYAKLNQSKARTQHKKKELGSAEAVAQFSVQFKLFSQSIANAVGMASDPDKADEQLSRLLIQLEELEGQFSDHDEFLADIISKRDEVYDTFETHKQSLIDERQRRAQNLLNAADRILTSINRRTKKLDQVDQLNTFFASDPLVMKVREVAEQLRGLDDSVKADDIESRLKSTKDQALRGQRDKADIYEDGGKIIKLGPKHRFSVTTQELELTILARNGKQNIHLNGTDFYEVIDSEELNELKDYWDMQYESETKHLYRAEYLVGQLLQAAESETDGLSMRRLTSVLNNEQELLKKVRNFAAPRYKEGYERGIHDHDATRILLQLLPIQQQADLLRYSPLARGVATVFWSSTQQQTPQKNWAERAKSALQIKQVFNQNKALKRLQKEIQQHLKQWLEQYPIPLDDTNKARSAEYLALELAQEKLHFVSSQYARELQQALRRKLELSQTWSQFNHTLNKLQQQTNERWAFVEAWLEAFLTQHDEPSLGHYIPETIALFIADKSINYNPVEKVLECNITNLMGDHPRIKQRTLHISLDDFLHRYQYHQHTVVPAYRHYHQLRSEIAEQQREKLRLEEFKARPLSSFVRNKLINELYLQLIGDNLAKQMGTVGEDKRSDLMGLLMMISPPGYGKTTLMEYIASRLGLIFMKINCPSLGHEVLSLDPTQAPNATAKQELIKLNLGLEMGNNVMLYLDDIQHTHPEFLQKFISLSDGTRRIEGVWKGVTKTYDMRGKRFCIIMAGNPYTESGEAFKVPDMLANRADIYNLGDMLGDYEEAFKLSYIENSLSSNPVLAPLATREMSDVYQLIALAKGKQVATSELKHQYSGAEVNEITEVFKKMFMVLEVILKVNQQYIASAAQNDEYRTEPPFKLQGSYRNMNKMAEKISAVMNQEEILQMISDHYLGEAQLLTSGAEENLLKLAQLRGNMTPTQNKRWEVIKDNFRKSQMKGNEEAIIGTEIIKQLAEVVNNLQQLNQALNNNKANDKLTLELRKMVNYFEQINSSLHNSDHHKQLAEQLAKIDENLQLLGQILLISYKDTTLSTQLNNISTHINGLNKSLTENNNDKLVLQLESIAKKLHAIEHSKGLAQSGEIISQQLKDIVDGIHAMHQELAKASAASVQKANWLTRRIGK